MFKWKNSGVSHDSPQGGLAPAGGWKLSTLINPRTLILSVCGDTPAFLTCILGKSSYLSDS